MRVLSWGVIDLVLLEALDLLPLLLEGELLLNELLLNELREEESSVGKDGPFLPGLNIDDCFCVVPLVFLFGWNVLLAKEAMPFDGTILEHSVFIGLIDVSVDLLTALLRITRWNMPFIF